MPITLARLWRGSRARPSPWRAGLILASAASLAVVSLASPVTGPGLWLDLAAAALAVGAIWLPELWLVVCLLFGVSQLATFEVSGVAMFLVLIGLFDVAGGPRRWLSITLPTLALGTVALWAGHEGLAAAWLFTWLLVFAWLSGTLLRRSSEQAIMRIELEQARRRQERFTLARDMHDIVAGSISHVALAAAELLTHDDLPSDARAGVGAIAEEARATLNELRGVIVLLRDDSDDAAVRATLSNIDSQWDRTARMLASCGFTTESQHGELATASAPSIELAALALRELGANVVRHGDPAGEVRLTISETGEWVNVVVSNRVRAAVSALPTSGSGLAGLRERLDAVGGTLRTQCDSDQWLAVARIPAPAAAHQKGGRR